MYAREKDPALLLQELVDKAPQLPKDIQWHFVGHLQSNKVKFLLEGCPGLSMLETVDSIKLANKLDKQVEGMQREPLGIMLQVSELYTPCSQQQCSSSAVKCMGYQMS